MRVCVCVCFVELTGAISNKGSLVLLDIWVLPYSPDVLSVTQMSSTSVPVPVCVCVRVDNCAEEKTDLGQAAPMSVSGCFATVDMSDVNK